MKVVDRKAIAMYASAASGLIICINVQHLIEPDVAFWNVADFMSSINEMARGRNR